MSGRSKHPTRRPPRADAVSLQVSTQTISRGPLPAPEQLALYEDLVPGSAERIIAMAESAQRHTQRAEMAIIEGAIAGDRDGWRTKRAGQVCSVIIALGSVVSAAAAAGLHASALAVAAIAGSAVGMAGIAAVTAGVFKKQHPAEVEAPQDSPQLPPHE